MSTNQIQKQILLKAPKNKVWRALTESNQFGSWFGMKLEGPFKANSILRGVIMPTTVDPEVAEMQKPYEGHPVELKIEEIKPEDLFSFKWHPYAVDLKGDYSSEPMTLVTFTLEPKEEGVLLTVTESGFDNLPITRRNEALKSNEGGWTHQMKLIEKYLLIHAK